MKSSAAGVTAYRRPLGYQQITAATLAASTPLTLPTLPAGIQVGYIVAQANGGVVRWRDDGNDPTSSLGMRIPDQSELDYVGEITAIRFILASGTPELNVSYYE